MICPKCGNLISYNSYFGAYYCSVCGEYFQEIKKTNADKIRGMNDKELAEFIINSTRLMCYTEDKVNGLNYHRQRCSNFEICIDCWMDWLQQLSED